MLNDWTINLFIYYKKIIKNNVKNGRKLYMKLVVKIIIVQFKY